MLLSPPTADRCGTLTHGHTQRVQINGGAAVDRQLRCQSSDTHVNIWKTARVVALLEREMKKSVMTRRGWVEVGVVWNNTLMLDCFSTQDGEALRFC